MRKFFTDRTPPTSDKLASVYDSFASTWRHREGKAVGWLGIQGWRKDLVTHLRGDVLEIGVADGETLVQIDRYDNDVSSFTGIDLSPAMILEAHKVATRLTIPVSLNVADAQELGQFADDSFDTVTVSFALCTIPDLPKVLAEISRVLRPGGRLVLMEHVQSTNPVVGGLLRAAAPWHARRMGCQLDRPTIDILVQEGYTLEEHRKRLFGVMRFVVAHPPV